MHYEVNHPCIQHKLSYLRDKEIGHKRFRELATEITMFLSYEALKNVKLKTVEISTPVAETQCHRISEEIVVVPILRAGVGMLDGILGLIPTARVAFIGLYRDDETKQPVEYYKKLPDQTDNSLYVIIDPMVATGGSTSATIDMLKNDGVTNILVICIVTCPEGIAEIESQHPDVQVYTASIDERLNEKKYIVPGLGDAGDRLFGTK